MAIDKQFLIRLPAGTAVNLRLRSRDIGLTSFQITQIGVFFHMATNESDIHRIAFAERNHSALKVVRKLHRFRLVYLLHLYIVSKTVNDRCEIRSQTNKNVLLKQSVLFSERISTWKHLLSLSSTICQTIVKNKDITATQKNDCLGYALRNRAHPCEQAINSTKTNLISCEQASFHI